MKAASLGHQYMTVKSSNENDSFFGGSRFRNLSKNRKSNSQEVNENRQLSCATEPLSRRIVYTNDQTIPSVSFIKRSISDTTHSLALYQSTSTDAGNKPYSLASILSKRRGKRDDNDQLSNGVRKFYKRQDDLIDSLEELHRSGINRNDDQMRKKLQKQKRYMEWLIRATMIVNCSLLIAKIIAAVFSRSLSIISSVVDSAVDSASGCLLFWAVRAIRKRDPYTYPAGRTRLEPLIIVILSVIMVSASVQVIYESVEQLVNYVDHFTKNSTELRDIDMGPFPITVMSVTIVCKAVLSLLCFQIPNPTMSALAQDHLNDVFSNIVALACGIVASKALDGAIEQTEIVVIDPIGAILISLYIIFCWLRQLRQQVRNLSGYSAEPKFLQKITWLTLNHSPLITQIDTVRAFHFGISFLVEVELILPETMTLKDAHDIGQSLKTKLEALPEVEIAFVHLDYTVDALDY